MPKNNKSKLHGKAASPKILKCSQIGGATLGRVRCTGWKIREISHGYDKSCRHTILNGRGRQGKRRVVEAVGRGVGEGVGGKEREGRGKAEGGKGRGEEEEEGERKSKERELTKRGGERGRR